MTALLILHRYLGVLVGAAMTLWCLSGFVMMYQGMPSLSEEERLAGLSPLALEGCCTLDSLPPTDEESVSGFRVEMLGDRPVLRVATGGPERLYDLLSGAPIEEIAEADARAAALAYRARHGLSTEIAREASVRLDQWTLQLRRHAPLRRFDFGDAAGSSLYVSGRTGEVVQATTARTRTLAWLGAVPHWLYPTLLRQNGPLWSQVVIWLSVLGIFLTVTGLYIGIARLRARSGRWFPYRRVWLWHHALGVFFGVLTLTWVASGLLTMQPWGLLASSPPVEEGDVYGTTSWAEARGLIALAPQLARSGEMVQVRSATLAGEPFIVARAAEGTSARYDADGAPARLAPGALQTALRGRGGALADATVALQETEDAYYYGHHQPVALPVLRVELADPAATRLYLDPVSGDFLRFVDDTARTQRWLESGLHRLDFPGLRRRPVWDVVVIALLAGVTALCATGTWLALSRVRRDLTPGGRFRRDPRQVS